MPYRRCESQTKERMQQRLDTLLSEKQISRGVRMDYYTILGVPQQADDNQIKQAYRKLAKNTTPT